MSIAFITALSERLRLRSDFTKQVLTLATGTAAAQALTILAAPLLTRLYRPEDYGVFALFGAVVGLAALLASGKYDHAVLFPKEDAAATALVGAGPESRVHTFRPGKAPTGDDVLAISGCSKSCPRRIEPSDEEFLMADSCWEHRRMRTKNEIGAASWEH